MPQPSKQPADGALARRGLRIIVADDDRDAVLMLATVLEHEGHDVREVYRGSEVLRMVREFDPDAALIDISMPGMTGYDVAREIRQLFRGKRPVLIAITGWKKTSDKILAQMAGFDHHLAKPFEADALLALLAEVASDKVE